MCNITKRLRRKTATMYKVVVKIGNEYYAYFAGMRIKLGKVDPEDRYHNINGYEYIYSSNNKVLKTFIYESLNNQNRYGTISGFQSFDDAKRMAIICSTETTEFTTLVRILKIKVGGQIAQGDAEGICKNLDTETTLFGTEVLEFKETKFRIK